MQTKPIPLIYVAGPFSAKPEQIDSEIRDLIIPNMCLGDVAREPIARRIVNRNIAKAVGIGIQIAKLGACPWIPHANSAHPEFERVQPYEWWIRATLEQLRFCHAIFMVPGWQESSGATREHDYAVSVTLPVFYDVPSIKHWLEAYYER